MSNDKGKDDRDQAMEQLFIEELGKVVGACGGSAGTGSTATQGGQLSTQALGEDGAPPLGGGFGGSGLGGGNGTLSTQALGEDGAPPLGGGFGGGLGGGSGSLSTQALGEDGAPPLFGAMTMPGK